MLFLVPKQKASFINTLHLCSLVLSFSWVSYSFILFLLIYHLPLPSLVIFSLDCSPSLLVAFILQNKSMQSSSGCWVPAVAIFLFLIATPQIESSHTFHHPQHHHSRLSRHLTNSLSSKSPSVLYHRTAPPSPLQPDEIDPRFEIDKRLVPGGPNPLHN